MQLTGIQRDQVRAFLAKIQSKEDLLYLLNAIKPLIDNLEKDQEFQPIKLNTLTFFSDHRLSRDGRYLHFSIKKKSGGERLLSAPVYPLKVIQQCIASVLSAAYEPKAYVTGFTSERSIVDNAAPHIGKRFIFNIDIKDFFPSIQLHRVKAVLKLEPFNLTDEREPLAFLIARLCCLTSADGAGALPQGAPTSPILSNIICQQLDRRLNGLAKRFGAVYTRYADDISFSADANIFHGTFEKEMRRIITGQHFTINEAKVRLQGRGYRQEVTGLSVNERVNVSKRYIRTVRAMLHNWQKLEYVQAEAIFQQHYHRDKGHVKQDKPILRNVLQGKLNYLKMVRGETDEVYMRYKRQYDHLDGRSPLNSLAKLEKLLSLWEAGGIDAAISNEKK
ncbi:reverse transcriptase domain-containing protein [Fibrella aquatica]|uniref:reverse transcriptase domain-containing protein n=1 Tax=Fibrella aquatica TaxID=3242487 RepID=UPI003522A92A